MFVIKFARLQGQFTDIEVDILRFNTRINNIIRNCNYCKCCQKRRKEEAQKGSEALGSRVH